MKPIILEDIAWISPHINNNFRSLCLHTFVYDKTTGKEIENIEKWNPITKHAVMMEITKEKLALHLWPDYLPNTKTVFKIGPEAIKQLNELQNKPTMMKMEENVRVISEYFPKEVRDKYDIKLQ